jgi:RNA polymerase sigma-70 factor (ECF subfamily)
MQTDFSNDPSALDRAASDFVQLRPRLFGIAYRMLGTSTEAEDIVQETWLRWQTTDRTVVIDPPAFLATTTTRLAINHAQLARSRRETYVGPWLPEPIDTTADPEVGAERGEAIELALLLLLEKLTPTERAAYVLREAFDYPYGQIAEILQLTEANTRQLVSRARKHIATERREPVNPADHRALLEAFLDAAQAGDLARLEALFSPQVASISDGGGALGAARLPVLGRMRVANFTAGFASRFWPGTTTTWVEANGQTGVLVERGGTAVALLSITASTEGIDQILWMMNPEKLNAFTKSLRRSIEPA